MKCIDLLGSCGDAESIDVFSRLFFSVIGVDHVEERESSNYVGGQYFVGKIPGIVIRVSLSDIAGNEDLLFWVEFESREYDADMLIKVVDKLILENTKPKGFKFARILNYGKRDQQRINY